MDDPEGVLEGSGKQLRHIKIMSMANYKKWFNRAF